MPAWKGCNASSWFVHSLMVNMPRKRRGDCIPPPWNRQGESNVFLPEQIRTVTSLLPVPLFFEVALLKSAGASFLLVKVISWLCWSRTSAFSNGAMKVKSKQSCLNYITHNEIIMRSIGCRIFLALKAFNEVQRHIVLFCFGSHFLLNTQTPVCVNKETLQAGLLKHLIVLHVLAGYSQD